MYINRIEVNPSDRKKFLAPIVHLCYDPSSPFNIKGPKFFAQLLFLTVNFRKNDQSNESLSIEEIDYEIGPDESLEDVLDTAELIEKIEGEEVEKMDALLSLAITGGDFDWI